VGWAHWLKQAKTTLISGMGGGSLCVERIGQPRFYTGFSRSASSSVLAKVLWRVLCKMAPDQNLVLKKQAQ
jgi:hypothetical protein